MLGSRPNAGAPRRGVSPAGLAAVLLIASGLAGCMTDREATGSITASSLPTSQVELRDYAATWGRRHDANPADPVASINYARALRSLTQYAQAVAVLETAAVKHPYDRAVLGAYGKALIDAGRLKEAAEVLAKAHTPDRPDWTILSAQGAVADQMGDHAAAVGYYEAALKIAPDEPSIMSNLGLSYALERRLPLAEATLRDAAAQPSADMRVRQNLALVLAVEGKYQDAEEVSRRALSAIDAAENMTTIKKMLAQSDSWRSVAQRRQVVAANADTMAANQTISNDLNR